MTELILTAATSVLGWAALRLVGKVDKLGKGVGRIRVRLIRVESKLDNGLKHELEGLRKDIERHIDGEEQRILQAVQRDPRARTRRSDRRRLED